MASSVAAARASATAAHSSASVALSSASMIEARARESSSRISLMRSSHPASAVATAVLAAYRASSVFLTSAPRCFFTALSTSFGI